MEPWKVEHDAAMGCRDFEMWLAETVAVFDLIDRCCSLLRRLVLHSSPAETVAASEVGEFARNLYAQWQKKAAPGLETLAAYESEYGGVEGAAGLRDRLRRVQAALAAWTPPVASLSPGLRHWDVTPEEADALHALSQAPPGSPGKLNFQPTSVPLGDASLIR